MTLSCSQSRHCVSPGLGSRVLKRVNLSLSKYSTIFSLYLISLLMLLQSFKVSGFVGVKHSTRMFKRCQSTQKTLSMKLNAGIVGLPNVGKSTLFNALVGSATAQAANFPFCTIEPNVGIVNVPDKRLEKLGEINKSEKVVPASMEFVDIAGIVKGASEGAGLGNKFLTNIRMTDAIVHVVRCFVNDDIIHVDGTVDPLRDLEVINLELIFADIAQIEKRLEKVNKSFHERLLLLVNLSNN